MKNIGENDYEKNKEGIDYYRYLDGTILLHLDRMEMERLKVSEALDPVLLKHMDPYECLDYLCENCVGEECRQSVRNFLEFDTIADRLKDQK